MVLEFITENIIWLLIGVCVILLLIGVTIANFSIDSYFKAVKKYSKIQTSFWGNSIAFANFINEHKFNNQIKIVVTADKSHNGSYSPHNSTVTINNELVANNIASIAVIAHELGHAVQHYFNPKILIKHGKLYSFVKFLGGLNPLILVASIALTVFEGYVWAFVGLGLVILNVFIALILKYSTLKIEKDASIQAIKLISEYDIFTKSEIANIKKFLGFAKRTYTADFLSGLLGWTGLVKKTRYFE